MSYNLSYSNRFKKSLKKCYKRGLDVENLRAVINILVENGSLPDKYRPHKLSGKFAGTWECHIEPDWLLLWEQNDTELTLLMIETGTHSDIFG